MLEAIDGRTVTRFDGTTATLHTAGAAIEIYQQSLAAANCLRHCRSQYRADPAGDRRPLHLYRVHIAGDDRARRDRRDLVLLGLSALSVLPINWLGAGLLAVAFTLFALEAKFASHGVLAVGGAVSMVLGAVMLIDSPLPEMRIHWSTAIGLALPFAAITVFLLSLAVRARRRKWRPAPKA